MGRPRWVQGYCAHYDMNAVCRQLEIHDMEVEATRMCCLVERIPDSNTLSRYCKSDTEYKTCDIYKSWKNGGGVAKDDNKSWKTSRMEDVTGKCRLLDRIPDSNTLNRYCKSEYETCNEHKKEENRLKGGGTR